MVVRMYTWTSKKLLFIFLGLFKLVLSFNIDVKYPVIKEGKPGTYFGFAVAQHKLTAGTKVEDWLLVSAPKSNSTYKSRLFQDTGAVFKCNAANSSKPCKDEVVFDSRSAVTSREMKKGQWFGVSLKSGGIDKSVLACAHRYMSYGPGNNFNLLMGMCRSMESDLKLTGYSFNPCQDYVKQEQVPSYENYGQCQTGIGLDIDVSPSRQDFLFGSVGVKNFEGRVFQRDSELTSSFVQSEGMGKMELSYFGYSMAHGKFFSTARKDVATGGPRSDSAGKVVLLKREPTKMSFLLTLPMAEDKVQLASAFGFAVCAFDLTSKSDYSYLLVGAPFHQNGEAEEGMVYIYLRSGEKSMKLVQKLTVTSPRANFGAAIVSAGDIDLDGYNDFVVGAPYEDNFAGAVYVFHGTSKGPSKIYSQKISASKVDSKLRAFGRSLAGGMDMDSNGYNDVLVGAYLSDRAALLRSRPVIKIIARIDTGTINPEDFLTEDDVFPITVYYRYQEKSSRLTTEIVADIKLTIDPGRTPRIKFKSEDTNVGKATVKLRTTERRKKFRAYLVRDKNGKFQSFPDVTMDLSFKLVEQDLTTTPGVVPSLDKRPILETHLAGGRKETTHALPSSLLKFARDCDPCIPDLSITTNNTLEFRLGKNSAKFDVTIKNKANGTAFQSDLSFIMPTGINVSLITLSTGEIKTCDDPSPYSWGKTRTVCKDLFSEIKSKAVEKIVVVLNTKALRPEVNGADMILNITSSNKENGTEADNSFTVNLSVVSKADLRLSGNAITKREFYGGNIIGESALKKDTEIGHVLKHRYYVVNTGPDLVTNAFVTIDWPIETVSGKHLLYLMDIQSPANCTLLSGKLNYLNLESSIRSSSNLNQSTAALLVSNQRRRRDVGDNSNTSTPSSTTTKAPLPTNNNLPGTTKAPQVSTSQPKKEAVTRMEGRVLDCRKGTAKCTRIVCETKEMPLGKGIPIEIVSRIWNSTLLMDYKGEILSVVSHASVAISSNASYITDTNLLNNKASIFSILFPETPKAVQERVAVWKIVLAVLAGIILLALLIFGLYKLGFFKRSGKSSIKKDRKSTSKEYDDLLEKKAPLDEKE